MPKSILDEILSSAPQKIPNLFRGMRLKERGKRKRDRQADRHTERNIEPAGHQLNRCELNFMHFVRTNELSAPKLSQRVSTLFLFLILSSSSSIHHPPPLPPSIILFALNISHWLINPFFDVEKRGWGEGQEVTMQRTFSSIHSDFSGDSGKGQKKEGNGGAGRGKGTILRWEEGRGGRGRDGKNLTHSRHASTRRNNWPYSAI